MNANDDFELNCHVFDVPVPIRTPWNIEDARRNNDMIAGLMDRWERADRLRSGKNLSSGEAWAQKALRDECAKVAGAVLGTNLNTQLNASSFALGQIVGAGYLTFEECERELRAACVAAGGNNPVKDNECISRGLREGAAQPRAPKATPKPSANGTQHHATDAPPGKWLFTFDAEILAEGDPDQLVKERTPANTKAAQEVFPIYSMPALLNTVFPPTLWVVQGLLSEGLNILAGSPKLGKSMLALNLAMTVAGGGMALQSMPVTQGDVLYLALEDTARRIKERAKMMAMGFPAGNSPRLSIATRWPKQEQGGLQMLDLWFSTVEKPTLVIIDVYQKFKPATRQGGSQYEQDYDNLNAVGEYMSKRSCNSLMLMHTRKAPSEDDLHMISGTQGLGGTADGVLILTRSRGENEAQVFVSGRDLEETKIAIQFDKPTLTWKSLGTTLGREESRVKAAIMSVFRKSPGAAFWPNEIACLSAPEKLGEAAKSWAAVVKTTVWRMEQEGLLKKIGSKYSWPLDEQTGPGEVPF
jgi:hypothetical protein